MGRLDEHLDHILSEVVPRRGAAQAGLDSKYIEEIEGRTQPPHLVRGLEQWNAGRFYEQHETLEWLWRVTREPVRDVLKGIIQSGVGAYHVLKQNRRGALAKWTGAIGYLEPFVGLHPYGIDIGHLREQVVTAREALLADEGEPAQWSAHEQRVRALSIRWTLRPAEPGVTALMRRLDRSWQESPLGLEPSIEALDEAEADWMVAAGMPSIHQLLLQTGVELAVATDRCFGEGRLQPEQVSAPVEWRRTERWLVDQFERVREPLGFLRDGELEGAARSPDRSHSIKGIIEELIAHNFYRAGMIQILRDLYRLRAQGE